MLASKETGINNSPGSSNPVAVAAAKRAVYALVSALSNYNLFPADHASTLQLVNGVHKIITEFVDQSNDLCIEIAKTTILYHENVIFEGQANDKNPIYVMYRDGLRRLEFGEGITREELAGFFQTFHSFREVADEPEDDLVSALWRLDLRHIFYRASDEFWEEEPTLDFSGSDLLGNAGVFSGQGQEGESSPGADGDATSGEGNESASTQDKKEKADRLCGDSSDLEEICASLIDVDHNVYQLNQTEKKILAQEIKNCVEQQSRTDVIGLMLLILNGEYEREAFAATLNYLKGELRISLEDQDFWASYFLMNNIKKIHERHAVSKQWTLPLWAQFYEDIAKAEILSPLIPVWQKLTSLDPQMLKNFTNFLRLLPPEAAQTFAAALRKISAANTRSLMLEIIVSFASRNMDVLATLLQVPEEDLGLRLLREISKIKDEPLAISLLKKAASHRIETVKNEAQKHLYHRGCL